MSSSESQIENCWHEAAFPTLHNYRPKGFSFIGMHSTSGKTCKKSRAKPVGWKFPRIHHSIWFLFGNFWVGPQRRIFEKSIPNTIDDIVLRPSISEFRGPFRKLPRRPRWWTSFSCGHSRIPFGTSVVGTKKEMSWIFMNDPEVDRTSIDLVRWYVLRKKKKIDSCQFMPVLWYDSKDTSGEDLKGSETCCCMSHSTKHDKCWTFAASVQNINIEVEYQPVIRQNGSKHPAVMHLVPRILPEQSYSKNQHSTFWKPSQRRFYLTFTKRWKLILMASANWPLHNPTKKLLNTEYHSIITNKPHGCSTPYITQANNARSFWWPNFDVTSSLFFGLDALWLRLGKDRH